MMVRAVLALLAGRGSSNFPYYCSSNELDVELPSATMPPTSFLRRDDGHFLAYKHLDHGATDDDDFSSLPGVVFCPGFRSSMRGAKVTAILRFCRERRLEFTTFDPRRRRRRRDDDEDEEDDDDPDADRVGDWKRTALVVLDEVASSSRKQILVGSSAGAWVGALVARERPERAGGLVGVGAAPDFTSVLSDRVRASETLSEEMDRTGYCRLPTPYDPRGFYTVGRAFLEEAENHFVLANESLKDLPLDLPIRLIHGKKDADVDCSWSEAVYAALEGNTDKQLILLDDGDHRLSKPEEIEVILDALSSIVDKYVT